MVIIKEIQSDKKVDDFINNIFSEQKRENAIKADFNKYCFVAYENNEIIGVVTFHTSLNEIHIKDLAVHPEHRNKNIGTQLLAEVENQFKDKEFEIMTLTTYDFQAPEFYRKNGFVLEFFRENKNDPKLSKYFFIKNLS
jgi:ribosomal protein S18 acetylase RimI-like enzyme